jgi:hypothetical protein
MMYLGDFQSGQDIKCCFHTTDAEGALIAPSVNGNASVIRLSDYDEDSTAISVEHNKGSVAGSHVAGIDVSDNPGWFLTGDEYMIKYQDATIDGVADCGAVIGQFSIENRYQAPVKLSADGLGDITITEPAGDPDSWSFEQKLLWLIMRFLYKHTSDNYDGIKVHKADGSLSTTQQVSEIAGVKIVAKAQ